MTGDLGGRIVVERADGFRLDVEFSAPAGETTVVVGPNGAGKSTLLQAVAGLVALDDGRLGLGSVVFDEPAVGTWVPPGARRLGVVFQDYRLFPHLDVLDNVAFGPASRGERRREARDLARPWLERMGLTALADRRPGALSGGQAQRVAIARALAAEPQALLLDEPLAALDVETRASLRSLLRRHLDETAGPRLVVSHDPEEAFLLGDRVLVLEGGRVGQAGSVADIRRHPATPYVARFAGTNLLAGTIGPDGTVALAEGGHRLVTAETGSSGPVLVTVRPNAVALHRESPHGSPRNAWRTVVEALEPLGSVTRVQLGAPATLAVDVTPAAAEALGLTPGVEVWASVKATELTVSPA